MRPCSTQRVRGGFALFIYVRSAGKRVTPATVEISIATLASYRKVRGESVIAVEGSSIWITSMDQRAKGARIVERSTIGGDNE